MVESNILNERGWGFRKFKKSTHQTKNPKNIYSRNFYLKNTNTSQIVLETKNNNNKNDNIDNKNLDNDNIIEKTKKVFEKINNKSNSMEKNFSFNKIDKIDKLKTGIININFINHNENNNINLFVN